MEYPTLPYEEMDAIVGGYHGDPFSSLGMHQFEDGVVVRAFLPWAESIDVMISSRIVVILCSIYHLSHFDMMACLAAIMSKWDRVEKIQCMAAAEIATALKR